MKKLAIVFALLSVINAKAAFIELNTTAEFEKLVATSTVPVVVQFAAYWCGPCQDLKGKFHAVESSYSDTKVRLAYVDAYVNSTLQKYLQGGYPTVRTFVNGKVTSQSFAGSVAESTLRAFIDAAIAQFELQQAFSSEDSSPVCVK